MRSDAARRTAGRTTTLRRLAQPWTLILVITGLFQLFRGAPIDAAFFLGIAALLLADAAGWLRLPGPPRPRAAWLLAAAIPLGIALVLAPRHGVVEGIIVSGIGATVLLFAWAQPAGAGTDAGHDVTGTGSTRTDGAPPRGTQTRGAQTGRVTDDGEHAMSPAVRRAAILWSVVGVACCLWEVASFLLGLPSPEAAIAHPSISALFDPILDTFEGRAIFTVLWLLLGIALLRRRGAGRGRGRGDTGSNDRFRARRRSFRRRARQ